MEMYTKIKYTPLKYRTEKKNISVPKDSILNSIGINKFKYQELQRNNSFNPTTMIIPTNIHYNTHNYKSKYLYYQYNTTDQSYIPNYNINNNIYNINNNLNNNNNANINPLNKTTPHYYSTKLKDKIINNLKDNFQQDKNKKKKSFYVNVNFNVNQNYTMPNYGKKMNRSVSVQNHYENKNNNNNNVNKNLSNKKFIETNLNTDNNNYFTPFNNENKNKLLKSIYDKEKQTLNINKNYNNQNKNNNNNLEYKRNPSYTKIFNYKSLEFPLKESKFNIINKSKINNKYITTTTNINKLNNNQNKNPQLIINNNNYNYSPINHNNRNMTILTEPKINNNHNILKNADVDIQINCLLYNLELKMQKLLGGNKTESKGKNYNIVRKIFEEGINIMNITQPEKNFLKLMMVKYHDIVYAFSQENKSLKHSSENLQNLNFTLDKKYLDLDKQYKLLLKENEEMKKLIKNNKNLNNYKPDNNNNNNNIIVINKTNKMNDNKDTIINNNNNINDNINNNMYKSIKDMDFIIVNNDEDIKKEENKKNIKEKDKVKDDNSINNNYIEKKINSIKNKIKEKEKNTIKNIKSNNVKNDNIKKKLEQFNRINIDDLDSLYFKDKVNDIKCYNSQKNYDKVPRIKLSKK